MTPAEFRAALAELGLTQRQAGQAFGLTERQIRRYASGESPVPKALASLLIIAVATQHQTDVVLSIRKLFRDC